MGGLNEQMRTTIMTASPAVKARGELQVFLNRCRERAGLSQEDVAKHLHLSARGYWNLEGVVSVIRASGYSMSSHACWG